jgi:predicted Zn-dependent protease
MTGAYELTVDKVEPSRRSVFLPWRGAVAPAWAALGLASLVGCAGQPVKPFEKPQEVKHISEEESRLWTEARGVDNAIRNSGQLYQDQQLEQYLQRIVSRLYPGFQQTIHVHVVRSPMLNAFALPNGSIYFNMGLLARMEDEAQLATVLGHETAHFILKHALEQRRQIKHASAAAIGVAIVGVPFADLVAISSVYGYSRDLERQADAFGFEHLKTAGYDVHESVKVFEILAAEAKALDEKHPVFFASHPKLEERIQSFDELIATSKQSGGRVGRDTYLRETSDIKLASLEADLSMDRYKSLILVLESDTAAARFAAPHRYYFLAEAYRRRNEQGDVKRAEAAYRMSLQEEPLFAPAYRGFGFLYVKLNDLGKARPLLEKYLELAPNAKDRAYVEYYLKKPKTAGGAS